MGASGKGKEEGKKGGGRDDVERGRGRGEKGKKMSDSYRPGNSVL